jgi:hypothetical protein
MPTKLPEASWGTAMQGVPNNRIYNNAGGCIHSEPNQGPCARCAADDLNDPRQYFQAFSLREDDVERCVRRLTAAQRDLLVLHPEATMIAGGFVRSCIAHDRIRDVDYFVTEEPQAQKMREQYVRWTKTPDSMIYRTDTALTIGNPKEVPIQLIYRFPFDTPADILSWFDFTISQGAIWFGHDQKWRGMCSERFYADLAAHRLIYTRPVRDDQDIRLFLRILKHVQLGYSISNRSLAMVMATMVTNFVGASPLKDVTDYDACFKDFETKLAKTSMSPDFEKLCQAIHPADPPKRVEHDWSS